VSLSATIGLALALAAAAALVVWRAAVKRTALAVTQYLGEVKGEVAKITWPSQDELRRATIVILIFVVVVALIIGAMDIILQWLLVRLPSRLG
jgi:preprotein translocase subunit SecE